MAEVFLAVGDRIIWQATHQDFDEQGRRFTHPDYQVTGGRISVPEDVREMVRALGAEITAVDHQIGVAPDDRSQDHLFRVVVGDRVFLVNSPKPGQNTIGFHLNERDTQETVVVYHWGTEQFEQAVMRRSS